MRLIPGSLGTYLGSSSWFLIFIEDVENFRGFLLWGCLVGLLNLDRHLVDFLGSSVGFSGREGVVVGEVSGLANVVEGRNGVGVVGASLLSMLHNFSPL